jgi:hypothetical protein
MVVQPQITTRRASPARGLLAVFAPSLLHCCRGTVVALHFLRCGAANYAGIADMPPARQGLRYAGL